MAIVAIFREPVSQGFHLLAQAAHLLPLVLDHSVLLRQQYLLLLDEFVSLRQLFPHTLILYHLNFWGRETPLMWLKRCCSNKDGMLRGKEEAKPQRHM